MPIQNEGRPASWHAEVDFLGICFKMDLGRLFGAEARYPRPLLKARNFRVKIFTAVPYLYSRVNLKLPQNHSHRCRQSSLEVTATRNHANSAVARSAVVAVLPRRIFPARALPFLYQVRSACIGITGLDQSRGSRLSRKPPQADRWRCRSLPKGHGKSHDKQRTTTCFCTNVDYM